MPWRKHIELRAEKAGHCTAKGRDRYNVKVRGSDLKPGDRVLVKNFAERGGPSKLRSFWENKIYVIKNRKGPDSPVYEIKPENEPGRSRTLHRNLLLPCPYLPYEAKRRYQGNPYKLRTK